MNILITYSTVTGNTKRLAEGIYEGLEVEHKTILPMSEVTSLDQYDTVFVGYWVDKGGPNEESKKFLETIEGKAVGLFATLGFWADSEHAWKSICNGEALVKERNEVIGRFICQGALAPKIIEQFEKLPADNPHAVTPEKRKRYEIAKLHPSKVDIASAVELFNERISIRNV